MPRFAYPSPAALCVLLAVAGPGIAHAGLEECLLEKLRSAPATETVGALRSACGAPREARTDAPDAPPASALDERIAVEHATRELPFVITPHNPNYLLPLAYNTRPNNAPFATLGQGELDHAEVKFQVSFKFPLLTGLLENSADLYFAYTNQSWWQAYNRGLSSPFRETNHEPEVFLSLRPDAGLAGLRMSLAQIGLSHQSNGRGGALSRGWNRVYANLVFERNNWYVGVKPWLRIPERGRAEAGSGRGDDNPDIEKYMGYGELRVLHKRARQTYGLMLRNNLRSQNYGALQLDWSAPVNERVRWYVQYFDGYGESLIDYNARVRRLGAGIMLTDWL